MVRGFGGAGGGGGGGGGNVVGDMKEKDLRKIKGGEPDIQYRSSYVWNMEDTDIHRDVK